MTDPILTFFGEYRFLSNFYPAEFLWDDILWPTSEHAYQAAKTLDRAERIKIATDPALRYPVKVKHHGSTIKIRDDWEEVKFYIMYDIVRAKFDQNPDLKQKLIATGNAQLEEGNTWKDRTWGVCPPGSGSGKNWLGKILMAIRKEYYVESFVSL